MSQRPARKGAVLVIDDSDISRAEMMRVLEEAGLEVIGLASPIGATRVILTGSVCAVVIDIEMPSLRGDRLAALFRGNPRMAGVGVVLVSGEKNEELTRLAIEARADEAVSKSALSGLPDAVRRAMARGESQRPFRGEDV
ncbi:MAG: response regulator [Myxococcales bacterium]|nr:MAG: response regulator [Myxococcales bacterium]